jgi:triosephosphate isomerase (TIM)
MDKKLIIANWKSHKTIEQSILFLKEFKESLPNLTLESKHIIICPSFHALAACKQFIADNNLPISVGAQNLSAFDEGAYTGDLAATQIRDLVEYVILGHSERRQYHHETDEEVAAKATRALSAGIVPIVCVRNEKERIPEGVVHVAFEPVEAIGSGKPDSPEHIQQVFTSLKNQYSDKKFIYGGSVTPTTILDFIHVPHLSGFLIGGASLEPSLFSQLLAVW